MKRYFCVIVVFLGGVFSTLIGGIDMEVKTLFSLMIIDFVLGVAVSLVVKKSNKSKTGKFNSIASFKGLVKKSVMILIIIIAVTLDNQLLTGGFIRLGTISFFMVNELMSIVENIGLIGVPLPKVITNALEVLNRKENENANND